ncbi:MAG: pilus assembly protein [Anaerolineae bacterium]|nr:pilus assembly protein [Anaerolineae bacterium]
MPHSKRGQSLVEVALTLPVLVILFFGIAELGFFLFSHVQVANATRVGARHGSLCRLNNNCLGEPGLANLTEVVESAVYDEGQALHMSGTNTQVAVQPVLSALPQVGTPITVTVTYTHSSFLISDLMPMFPDDIPVQHSVIMDFDK